MEAMARLGIGMDKYKTASLGRALKKVYRGEMRIAESVAFASSEISEVFSSAPSGLSDTDVFDGFFGDIAGKCPLCGRDVIRTRYGYGCSGYKEGCKFHIGGTICGRVISLSNARLLLETGHTAKITGFVSRKTGKTFCASLCLKEGKAVFDFSSALPSQNVIQAEE
ncbi:hypothetical protein SDC9_141470 [bioreactor metagenome]|uniref:DNA topoisomerase 3 n=1 Tax=bioreactor metagenome TaxID=1076179 RepID=A0A645DXR8_9ZZZZ